MSAMNNAEFADRVLELSQQTEPFAPAAYYDRDGDCVEFICKPDPFYAKRFDDLVTVYFSQETDEVVGALIKGAGAFCKKMLETMPGFRIEIKDGRRVKLEAIFRLRIWSQPQDPQSLHTLTYEKLLDAAEESDTEVDNLCLV